MRILAVTVLTSYDDADLAAAGYDMSVAELAAARAQQARDTGVDGLVCSAEEATNLRGIIGPDMVLVTPGIRPAGSATGDQKRVMTPARAIAAGADYLVVGRPIVEAADPTGGGRARSSPRSSKRQASNGRGRHGEGLLDRTRRCEERRGLQALCRRQCVRSSRSSAAGSSSAPASSRCPEGTPRARNVVIEFPDYATALACYRSPEYQENIKRAAAAFDRRYHHHRGL